MRFLLFFVALPVGIIMIALSDWLEKSPYWIVLGSVLLFVALTDAMHLVLRHNWRESLRPVVETATANITVAPVITVPPVIGQKESKPRRKKAPYRPFKLPHKRQRRQDLRAMEARHARRIQSSCDGAARAFSHQVVRR